MNRTRHQIFWWVFGTHAVVLFLLLVIPWVKGLFRPKPKEIITFVDLAAPMPEPVVPEPVIAPPEPVKKTIAPPPTNPPPKKVESKPPPKKEEPKKPEPPPEPEKPKWKPAPVVRQNNRVANPAAPAAKPVQPQIDVNKIRTTLAGAVGSTGSGSSSGGTFSPFAGYYSTVQQRLYAAWQQPAGTPIGTTATAVIRVERDGTLSYRSVSRRSGNATFDASVQKALDAVSRLPAPPADLPDRNITIEFVLSN